MLQKTEEISKFKKKKKQISKSKMKQETAQRAADPDTPRNYVPALAVRFVSQKPASPSRAAEKLVERYQMGNCWVLVWVES